VRAVTRNVTTLDTRLCDVHHNSPISSRIRALSSVHLVLSLSEARKRTPSASVMPRAMSSARSVLSGFYLGHLGFGVAELIDEFADAEIVKERDG